MGYMSRIQAKTDAFRAIADPTRRAILDRLRAGPANAGTLASDFQSSRPAVSRHLRVLREARLVVDTRIGRERVYAVNPVQLRSVPRPDICNRCRIGRGRQSPPGR